MLPCLKTPVMGSSSDFMDDIASPQAPSVETDITKAKRNVDCLLPGQGLPCVTL